MYYVPNLIENRSQGSSHIFIETKNKLVISIRSYKQFFQIKCYSKAKTTQSDSLRLINRKLIIQKINQYEKIEQSALKTEIKIS